MPEQHPDNVARHLAAFEKTKDPIHLKEALEAAEGLTVIGAGPARIESRKKIAKSWFDVLASIDHNLDPAFDPNNPPPERVSPPSSGNVSYPTGIDPKSVADPVARAQYTAALEEHNKKVANYSLQVKLRRIDPTATKYSDHFFSVQYSSSAPDQQEFDSLLRAAKLSPLREQHLKAIFQKK